MRTGKPVPGFQPTTWHNHVRYIFAPGHGLSGRGHPQAYVATIANKLQSGRMIYQMKNKSGNA